MFQQAAQLLGSANVGQATNIAQQHFGGSGGEDKGLLSNILSSVMKDNNTTSADQNDVNFAAQSFNKIYNQNQQSSSVNDLGSAAAMQAFKLFSGGSGGGGGASSGGGGGSSDQVTGLAMGEAMKLFNSSNNAGAPKNDILKTAIMWAIKLFMTKQQGASNPAFGALMSFVGGGSNSTGQQPQQQQPLQQQPSQQQPSQQQQQQQQQSSNSTASNIASSIFNKFM
ncbi:hypothetical protein INT45_003336 [Circinella minor]|uniref:DUF7721 domain-containing protein n=1 Tax=Circinella minor TaxID=1195481 RepID=A0A8H7VKK7_9FUNG|nr:hypothetical protein INT45_003336 [Circinella minor]